MDQRGIRRGQLRPYALTFGALLAAGCASVEPSGGVGGLGSGGLSAAAKAALYTRYFTERRADLKAIATTRTQSGQIIDWIKIEDQTTDGVIASPPPLDPKENASSAEAAADPNLKATLPADMQRLTLREGSGRTELQIDGAAFGPPGTVPVVRFDITRFLASVRDFESLPDDPASLLTKTPPPKPDANDRYYAVWQRSGDVLGTSGRINIWDTVGPVDGETSIAQTAVIRGSPMQAIEAGKIETRGFSPANQPTFFTYYRTNGSASGDWIGGYNRLVKGWVQVSRSVAPGMSLVAWNSTRDGTQYSLDVEVRLWQGNWWVWAAGEWAGYYPNCSGGDAPPCDTATLFSASGIRDKADRLDWYGEVFDSSAPAATTTDMGSGAFANEHWGRAAYFRNITYYWAPATYWWWDSGSIGVTDANCYSAEGPHYSSDPNYRNWFYYGGPGDEARGCD